MLCRELMKPNVECLSPQESIQVAAQRMRDINIGFLPVCDNAGKVLGTITDRDITIRAVAENRPSNTPVERVMTQEVVAVKPSEDVKRAEQLMGQHHKSRIMCIENGKLVGVISLSDIAQRDGAGAAQTIRAVSEREART